MPSWGQALVARSSELVPLGLASDWDRGYETGGVGGRGRGPLRPAASVALAISDQASRAARLALELPPSPSTAAAHLKGTV